MAKSYVTWDERNPDENWNTRMVVDKCGALAWGQVLREVDTNLMAAIVLSGGGPPREALTALLSLCGRPDWEGAT